MILYINNSGMNTWQYEPGHATTYLGQRQCIQPHYIKQSKRIVDSKHTGHSQCYQQQQPTHCNHFHHTTHGLLPIHVAIRAGNSLAVSALIEESKLERIATNSSKRTYSIVEMNDRCIGWSCTHYAVQIEDESIAINMIQVLYNAGASINFSKYSNVR